MQDLCKPWRLRQRKHPVYTRPPEYQGMDVPEVLRSGDHAAIERWREEEAAGATARRRPELGDER